VSAKETEAVRKVIRETGECLKTANPQDPEAMLRCSPDGAKAADTAKKQLQCVRGKGVEPFDDGLIDCVDQSEGVERLRACFSKNKNDLGALASECAESHLPPEKAAVARCTGSVLQAKDGSVASAIDKCGADLAAMPQQLALLNECRK